jgi:hypothetical protein
MDPRSGTKMRGYELSNSLKKAVLAWSAVERKIRISRP